MCYLQHKIGGKKNQWTESTEISERKQSKSVALS